MENNNNNRNPNQNINPAGDGQPQALGQPVETPNTPSPSIPPVPTPPTPPLNIDTNRHESSPTFTPTPTLPHSPNGTGGKGGALIIGGILFIFILIVAALYFLIIKQSSQPETRVVPTPIPQEQPTEAPAAPVNQEEEEVINIDLGDNLDEEFAPIDADLNQL